MRLSLALWRQIYRLLYSMTVKVAWPKNSFLFSSQYHKLNPKFYASLLQGILDFRFNFCWSNKKMVLIDLQQLFTLYIRVDMVGTNRDKVLTLWRHMPMGQFHAKIFLIQLTSTYFWASEVGEVKVDYFDFSWKK